MENTESGPVKWDLDSDEIASITSEDLHTHRPNRWKGPKSSWRTLTEEDRLLWQSMKSLQDQDLAVHLYDAFALKRRGRDPKSAQDLRVTTVSEPRNREHSRCRIAMLNGESDADGSQENGQEAVWAPPKFWTAWPLKSKHIPRDRLIKDQHDEDEPFTFRRQEQTLPSTELEEELSATILRTAKERFQKRKSKMARPSIEDLAATVGDSGIDTPGLSSRETSVKPETENEEEEAVQLDTGTPARRTRRQAKTYEPVVSTNDDLSYELLKPSVRHILSQLDTTLTILHNSRLTGLTYLSDSSTEDESDSQTGPKRTRGRPRADTSKTGSPGPSQTPKTTKRGRPRKVHIPQDGENEEAMLLRIARESHRRLPTTPKDDEAAFEEWIRKGDETIERERSASIKREESEGIDTEIDEASGMSNIDRKRMRWGLRDWSDVVGAAALAGFPSEVIARTTQRCADLFGEGMVLRQLNQVPTTQGTGIETTTYTPEPIRLAPSSPSSTSSTDDETTLTHRRITSRQASLARSSHSPPSTPRGRRSTTRSPAASRSGSSAGLVFCPIASCDRAAQGFTRKANLRRHMELVHQGQAEDVDSEDEVVGGVHVDGFLRKIVPGRGWRGEDVSLRRRKRWYKERSLGSGEEREDSSS